MIADWRLRLEFAEFPSLGAVLRPGNSANLSASFEIACASERSTQFGLLNADLGYLDCE